MWMAAGAERREILHPPTRVCVRAGVCDVRAKVFGAVCCCDWDGGRQKTSSAIGCLRLGKGEEQKKIRSGDL